MEGKSTAVDRDEIVSCKVVLSGPIFILTSHLHSSGKRKLSVCLDSELTSTVGSKHSSLSTFAFLKGRMRRQRKQVTIGMDWAFKARGAGKRCEPGGS
jgi:hypothetical protein